MKFSIVCSVYNNERYIHKCVDSILAQTLNDFELILIDNGCDDNCPQIIDDYATKDSRIIAIHNPVGSTYGKALNQGIAMAKGDYIGIVESDDFIHQDMYSKLYTRIREFDADIAIAGFWVHINGNNDVNNIHNKQIFDNSNDNSLFCLDDFPFLMTCHPCIWAKLYKSTLIKNIKFNEKGKYIDYEFLYECYFNTNKIIALKEPVYYYRFDNPNASNSNNNKSKGLMKIADDLQSTKKMLIRYNVLNKYNEEFYFSAIKPLFRFYKNIDNKYRLEFFDKIYVFFKDIENNGDFDYKYFNAKQKDFVQKVLARDFYGTIYKKYKNFKLFGILLYEKYVTDTYGKVKILGFTVKKTTHEEKIYIKGIFKKKIQSNKIKYYLFGIHIYNHHIIDINRINDNIEILNKKIDACMRRTYNIVSHIQASAINRDTFLSYKGAFIGKKVVLVACGPSQKEYVPMADAIHVGVNRSFLNDNIKHDYLFVQDFFPEGMEKVNEYGKDFCQKFYGILPPERSKAVFPVVRRIPPIELTRANALPYILQDTPNLDFAYNLASEPVGDFQGCVFSALQFICYAHPKEIYLVGCDCSQGHFYDNSKSDVSYQLRNWKRFKNTIINLYPDITIYSVNPVGLKGLFTDIYTKKLNFIKENNL